MMRANELVFVTGNKAKLAEAEAIMGLRIRGVSLNIPEIQSLSVVEVARAKAQHAFDALRVPLIVDDTGLAITALGGLPGALVTWFLDSIGTAGIMRLMAHEKDRTATASTCICFFDGNVLKTFVGTIDGTIAEAIKGESGFGYDSIFVPHGSTRTYGEMSADEKGGGSMRAVALAGLAAFLKEDRS